MLGHDAHDLLAARDHLADVGDDRRLHAARDRRSQRQVIELGLSLGEALLDVFRPPLGVLQFLGVLRDEVLNRLVGIAGDDLEPRGEGSQILLLLRLLGDLILQGFGGVDDRGLRARLHFDELRAHVDALLQGRDEVLLRRDRLPQFVAFGGLLRSLGVE